MKKNTLLTCGLWTLALATVVILNGWDMFAAAITAFPFLIGMASYPKINTTTAAELVAAKLAAAAKTTVEAAAVLHTEKLQR